MPKFIFTYHAPDGYQLGEPDAVAAWQDWFKSMGEHLDNIGNPVLERRTVGNAGDATQLDGFSLIEADDLEAATVLAKGCPFVGQDGGVTVGQLAELPD